MVLALLFTMATVGVLPAVGLGVLFSGVTFLLNYSRASVIRHRLSGLTLSSHVSRVPQQQQILQKQGNQIQVLQLQGYLFFGSANQLLRQVKPLLTVQDATPQYIILDFAQVSGIDSSAVYSFIRLQQTTPPDVFVVLTHLTPGHRQLLDRAGCFAQPSVYHLEPDLEQGLRWCEEELLAAISWRRKRYMPLPLLLGPMFADADHIPTFMTYLEQLKLNAEAILFEFNQRADTLYFLESGQVSTYLDQTGQSQREWTYQSGTIIGTTAFYLNQPYTVRALVEQPSIVFTLHRNRWEDLKRDHSDVAAAFQEILIAQLSGQLQRTSADLNTLLF
jgi:SulP family sulfate permease